MDPPVGRGFKGLRRLPAYLPKPQGFGTVKSPENDAAVAPDETSAELRSKESVSSSSASAKRMSLASGKVGTECGPFLNDALSRGPRRTTRSWLHALGPVVLTGSTPISATKFS
jgi:hypothetical protein